MHAKISCGPKFLGVSPGHRMNLVSSMLRKSFLNVCTCLIMCGLSSVLAITQVVLNYDIVMIPVYQGGVTPIDPVLPPATGVKILDRLF